MEDLFAQPWLLLVAGYVLARWDKRGDQAQTQSVAAATVMTRLEAAEDWIRAHSQIKADFAGLAVGLETMTDAIKKLTERFDEFLSAPKRAAR